MEIMPDIIKKNQAGFALIELLVSMAIISIVVTGIVTSRMSQQNQSITQQQAVDVQQTVSAALSNTARHLHIKSTAIWEPLLPVETLGYNEDTFS